MLFFRDFEAFMDPDYGQCFTFNYQSPVPKYYTSKPGPQYGLRLVMISNLSEYLHTTQQAGVRVTVHPQGHNAFPSTRGQNAGVGSAASFRVQFVSYPGWVVVARLLEN